MTKTEPDFVARVTSERQRQREMWGDAHDDRHTMTEWSGVILLVAGRVATANESVDYNAERKKRLVQLAATCWAEYQAIERKELRSITR